MSSSRPWSIRLLGTAVVVQLLAGLVAAGAVDRRGPGEPASAVTAVRGDDRRVVTVPTTEAVPLGPVPVPLGGCPPPPVHRPPGPPGPAPWHPAVLVPESRLPAAPEPVPASADLGPLEGKGMWVWKYGQTEKGDARAIVARAVATGLHQLWVRVGDSRDGFYAGDVLGPLVSRAHAAGLAVIGWGFPYLWDPVADAAWSADALAWRTPGGEALDGFSPDVESSTEGVVLTDTRARVYLGLVRRSALGRLVVATVYRPTDRAWASYPYGAMAPYVDAFAPMVYWGCTEPGAAAAEALGRLSALRPVHLIGQGYDMADDGGRAGPPDAAETARFLDVARRGGALGASFWVWQSIDDVQWGALATYPWQPVAHR
ncbi:MAG: hypothetical protein ACR2HY_01435 [Acidimicrobiales bacterium]